MFLIVKGLIIQSKSGIQIYPKTGRGGPENNGQKIYNGILPPSQLSGLSFIYKFNMGWRIREPHPWM